jgi:hypothetical protein
LPKKDEKLIIERATWMRITGEALLIVASVFVAITLESMFQNNTATADAHAALAQMLQELKQDQADLEEVLEEQEDLDEIYRNLLNWFASPTSLPNESVHKALRKVSYSNRTMYARRSAWTTMVAGGQLALLGNSELVIRLGKLYETVNERVKSNNDGYDHHVFTFARESIPRVWDLQNKKLLTDDPAAIAVFRGQLFFLHNSWNRWYLEFLAEYQILLVELIAEIESHLESQGYS